MKRYAFAIRADQVFELLKKTIMLSE